MRKLLSRMEEAVHNILLQVQPKYSRKYMKSKKHIRIPLLLILFGGILISCKSKEEKLPILESKDPMSDGRDTIYHQIPDFSFTNQDGKTITAKTFENKVYIADFFFTSCTTICPIMGNEMQRVYNKYKDNEKVAFISHSIDPNNDSISVLKNYSDDLGVNNDQWHFVTGQREKIFDIAENHYMVSAQEYATVPDGVIHSGAFILVDSEKRIRGYYDGTNTEEVDK